MSLRQTVKYVSTPGSSIFDPQELLCQSSCDTGPHISERCESTKVSTHEVLKCQQIKGCPNFNGTKVIVSGLLPSSYIRPWKDNSCNIRASKSPSDKVVKTGVVGNSTSTSRARQHMVIELINYVQGLTHACENIVRVLSKQSPLHKEGALLSRFIYKYNKKFRNDIGYRNIRKTNTSLHKYLQVNLLKDVEYFMTVLPNEDDDFIPTRQMLEYVLSRIITFAMLMLRINLSSKQAAVFYVDRIKRGESHWMSLMPYALLSRIWSMCAILLQHAASWYSCLHSYLPQLQYKGLQFLPGNCKLPEDLNEWLDLKHLDTFSKLKWTILKSTKELDLSENEESDSFEKLLQYASYSNDAPLETEIIDDSPSQELKVEIISNDQQFQLTHLTKIDQGQVISRDNFKSLHISSTLNTIKEDEHMQVPTAASVDQEKSITEKGCIILTNFQRKIRNTKKGIHYFGGVTNANSLKEFLDKEEIFRNDGNKHSLTNHLSFMQWHSLKTSLLKLCNSVLNNKKIERKLQKVWKEKCLDYI